MFKALNTEWLGRISYAEGVRVQEAFLERKLQEAALPDHLYLLEHDPVYTVGRSVSLEEALGGGLPHPLVQVSRGGKITFHGPGQLVGYPLLDLRLRGQDLHRHLRLLEYVLVELSRSVGVRAATKEGLTGVWVGERKLASIGVGVRRWISLHGFAINICGPLEGFSHITPCGLEGVQMTSLEAEGAAGLTVEKAAALAGEIFAARYSEPRLAVDGALEAVGVLEERVKPGEGGGGERTGLLSQGALQVDGLP
jgi:lipoyl(octanoyl) transferase